MCTHCRINDNIPIFYFKKFNINESEKAKEEQNSIKMGKNNSQNGLQVIHPGTDETVKKDSKCTESIPIPKINATNENDTSKYWFSCF